MKTRVLFPLVLLLALAASPVHAQSKEPPVPAPPAEGHYVLDELDWLTGDQETGINSIIRRLDHDGVAEIALVTLDDCGSDRLAFRKSLFDAWGIGHADEDDGLLILVCWYAGDPSRRSVEQLFGPGLNGILNSSKTDRIAQTNFVPAFQQGKPGDGLEAMITSYNIILRAATGSGKEAGESGKSSNPLVRFYESIGHETKVNLFLLLAFGILVVLNHFFSRWFGAKSREDHYREDYGNRDGFGGGKSDGGGGSSTRF